MTKRSLRQIKKEKLSKEDIKKAADKAGINCDVENMGDISSLEETIEHYQDKDEDELKSELLDMVEQGKQDGTFTDEMLSDFVSNVSPMMDKEQKSRLKSIADMLKSK